GMMNVKTMPEEWNGIVQELTKFPCNNSIWSIIRRLCLGAMVSFVWQERKARLFRNESRTTEELSKAIMETIKLRIISIKLKNSKAVMGSDV
ncbi:hypothetical protein Tco_0958272, partial [Tanacetum coccineum]